ncbi:MAG: hypothetical protein ACXADB_08595 [Candidatus Hermodarchaeia archaeon]
MIGTTVWAKGKPDKPPGKPSPPEPKKANYNIWIGEVGQDIFLNSPSPLPVENVVGGDWLPPPTKRKYALESWSVDLLSLDPPEGPGDDCGKYIIYHEELAVKLVEYGVKLEEEAYAFIIEHRSQNNQYGEYDCWFLGIAWQVGTFDSDPDIPHLIILMGSTDGITDMDHMDPEWEGVYNENDDTWIVTFDKAEFGVFENTETGGLPVLWKVDLSFTVKIERTLV